LINSLAGTPAVPPPASFRRAGTFSGGSVNVTLVPADTNSTLYYTLDGSLPTTSSSSIPDHLRHDQPHVNANAFRHRLQNNSVAAPCGSSLLPPAFSSPPKGSIIKRSRCKSAGSVGKTYVSKASTNLVNWGVADHEPFPLPRHSR